MELKSLEQLTGLALMKKGKKLIVAVAQDEDVLKAISAAIQSDIVIPVLVGDSSEIASIAKKLGLDLKGIEIVHEPDKNKACITAVKMISGGKGDLLMKGMVSTNLLIRAVLDKEYGLVTGGLLSHLSFFETKYYPKIFCITDAALNISPDLNEKVSIIRNAVAACHKLGIPRPLVAVLAPVETVNPKMEATVHAAMLTQMQKRNQIEGCVIDGPLALDNAVSKEAATHKGIKSEVAGNADILLTPDLNAGNMLYKSLNFLGGAVSAAVVAGASVPIVLTSRADLDRSKYLSIALAVAMA